MVLQKLPLSILQRVVEFHKLDYLTFGSVCSNLKEDYLIVTHNLKETCFSLAAYSIEKFNLHAKCLKQQYNHQLVDLKTCGVHAFALFQEIFGWRGSYDDLPITCQFRKQVIVLMLIGEHGNIFAPQLRIAAGIKLQNQEICQNVLNTQKFFGEIFSQELRDKNLEVKSFAYCLIEQFSIDFIIECANKRGFVINQNILQNATIYLKTDDIQRLCSACTIEIDYFGMKHMISLSMILVDSEKISLLCNVGMDHYGNDAVAEMVIELMSMRRDGVMVEVFDTLISSLHFTEDKMARLIVELAAHRQSRVHLRSLCRHSPFNWGWCIENINIHCNDNNRIAMQYLRRQLKRRRVS